jgi:hypothetical protein
MLEQLLIQNTRIRCDWCGRPASTWSSGPQVARAVAEAEGFVFSCWTWPHERRGDGAIHELCLCRTCKENVQFGALADMLKELGCEADAVT